MTKVIPGLIEKSRRFGSKTALRDARRSIRFEELERETFDLDAFLREGRGSHGFVLGTLMANRVEYPLAYLAAFSGGYPIVPLDPGLPAGAIESMVRDAEVSALLVDSTTARMARELELSCRVVDIDGPREQADYFRGWIDIRPSTLASINFTSGTTGRPRGVMLSHRNYMAACRNFLDNFAELREFRRVLHVLPFHHSTAALLLPAIACGISSIIVECGDAAAVLDAADIHEPDCMVMHPELIGRILSLVKKEPGELRKLRTLETIFYGSSSINPMVIREAMETIGPVFAQAYGMTEALPPVAVLDRDDHVRAIEYRQFDLFSSCGKPARGVDVKIVDDSGREIRDGEPGELLVRGGNVMEGYLGLKEETQDFLRDGWAHTGDMAKRKDGYLYIMGRKDDLITRGNTRIFPSDVERIIAGIGGVKDCAVFGVPDEKEGQVPVCAVVLDRGNGNGAAALKNILADRLPDEKMPVEIIVMDRLPRSTAGKIDRNMIRRSVAREGGAARRTR